MPAIQVFIAFLFLNMCQLFTNDFQCEKWLGLLAHLKMSLVPGVISTWQFIYVKIVGAYHSNAFLLLLCGNSGDNPILCCCLFLLGILLVCIGGPVY